MYRRRSHASHFGLDYDQRRAKPFTIRSSIYKGEMPRNETSFNSPPTIVSSGRLSMPLGMRNARPLPEDDGYGKPYPRSRRTHSSPPSNPPPPKDDKTFKKLMHKFMGYTTAHGIGRLGDSKTFLWRLFWSLVCMGALGMFLYQVIGLFQQFFSKPISTSVSITFEKKLAFPAVTICNLNMLRKDVVPSAVKSALQEKVQYSEWTTMAPQTAGSGEGVAGSGEGPTGAVRRRRDTSEDDREYEYMVTEIFGKVEHSELKWSEDVIDSGRVGHEGKHRHRRNIDGTSDDSSGDYSDATPTDYHYDGIDYSDYNYDPNAADNYYDEDSGDYEDEYPDADRIDPETKLKIEIAQLVAYTDVDELYGAGHAFDDLVQNCTWKGLDCKLGNLSIYWKQSWDYGYGNCYTFNGGVDINNKPITVLSSSKPGPSQGLVLTLNIEQDLYIGPLTVEAGVRVLLHDQGEMIFPQEEGFSVSPGMSTSVGLKKTKIVRLDRFDNDSCLTSEQLSERNIYRNNRNVSVYSQQACLNSCLGATQRAICNCSEVAYPTGGDPCDVFDKATAKCLLFIKILFNNDDLKCLSDCRQPCTEEVIQKTISSSQWPSKSYKAYLTTKGVNFTESDDLLQLNIFYNELNYENIVEEFSYGRINLLADIGGQLGLWIGISVLTVCELIELFMKMFSHIVKKCDTLDDVDRMPPPRYGYRR